MKKRKIFKCPKCKLSNLDFREIWSGHNIIRGYNNGVIDKVGYLSEGDPFKVVVECNSCSHKWTIKKATQITDVFPEL